MQAIFQGYPKDAPPMAMLSSIVASLAAQGFADAESLLASFSAQLVTAVQTGTLTNSLVEGCGCVVAVTSVTVAAPPHVYFPTHKPTGAPTKPPTQSPTHAACTYRFLGCGFTVSGDNSRVRPTLPSRRSMRV